MTGRHRWFVEYMSGETRVIWSDFREPMQQGGALSFYNVRNAGDAVSFTSVDHIFAIAAGVWKEVTTRDDLETVEGTLQEIGKPDEMQRRVRQTVSKAGR